MFWWNEAVEVTEAIEAVEATEVAEAVEVLRPGKSLLRTSESSWHLISVLFLCSEKTFFGVESWNIILNFSTFSVRGCWGQPMSFFWKLVDKTKMYEPPEATRHHKLIKLLILLPLRADLLCTLHYETPCNTPSCDLKKNTFPVGYLKQDQRTPLLKFVWI